MFRGIYSLLMTLGQPLLRRKLARRGRKEPGYLQAIDERFGRYTQPAEKQSELVWVHAVSLGETRTAGLLLGALRAQHPGLRILLTHGTATGRAEGIKLLNGGDVQVWQPWDSAAAVARFFSHFKPRLGLLMETEIWPNLVADAQARHMPLVVVNGRLSEKSLQQALRLSQLAMPAYAALKAVYAQTDDDARRFRLLRAPVEGVFGNLKFDAAPNPRQQQQGKAWREALGRPVIMFASSREGEENDFFAAISAAAEQRRLEAARNFGAGKRAAAFPAVLVVPRHPQRFHEVQALAEKNGLTVSRRSSWTDGPANDTEAMTAYVWLGDSLGEMALYYSMSDVTLLGGSFAQLGGQNLIEAAACGCPIIMGPHTFNFSEAAELAEAAGAALRVPTIEKAVAAALRIAGDPKARTAMVTECLAFTQSNRGATQKTLAALEPFLGSSSRS